MKNDSYFSGWTGNLGVVPLFLFSAFLLAPIFFFLFLRIIFVCLVFEAIILSCTQIQFFKKFRNIVLAVFRIKVKDLAPLILIICCVAARAEKPIIKYIQQGEQFSLQFPKHSQYSIGDKKSLKAKVLTKRRKLLLKGIKPGLSDLIIWGPNYSTSYQIYITDFRDEHHKAMVTQYLNEHHFKFDDNRHQIKIHSSLNSLDSLEFIHRYCQDKCLGELSPHLSRMLIKDIYLDFLSLKLPNIQCKLNGLKTMCRYQHSSTDLALIFKKYKKYGVSFQNLNIEYDHNIKVQFKLIQIESSRNETLNLGFDQLQSQLAPFLKDQATQSLNHNPVNLNHQDFKAISLASPTIITTKNVKNEIRVGSEVPFETQNQFASNIQWKFAGLKMDFKLVNSNQKLLIKYKTEISSQDGEQIKSHIKQAELLLKPQSPNLLFEIDLKSFSQKKQRTSFFSKIPLLGKLFRGQTDNRSFSKVLGIVQIQHI